MTDNYKNRLIEIVNRTNWLIWALGNVRSLRLPDWYIAAGAVRNTVWSALHGYPTDSVTDVDVVYFKHSSASEREDEINEELLRILNPSLEIGRLLIKLEHEL